MKSKKLSISLPKALISFVEDYQINHAYREHPEVFQDALKLLQEKELRKCYRKASKEIDLISDNTIIDGLDNAW